MLKNLHLVGENEEDDLYGEYKALDTEVINLSEGLLTNQIFKFIIIPSLPFHRAEDSILSVFYVKVKVLFRL